MIIAFSIIAALTCGMFYANSRHVTQVVTQHITPPKDMEAYIRSAATNKLIDPLYIPALIYSKEIGKLGEQFCCMGTVFIDEESELQILTVEHLFRIDYDGAEYYRVEPLLPSSHFTSAYIGRITKTSKDFNGTDAVTAKLHKKPITHPRFSLFTKKLAEKTTWEKVILNGKEVPTMRSLITGEVVRTIGFSHHPTNPKANRFVALDMKSFQCQSGSIFIDEYGGKWHIHAQIEDPIMEVNAIIKCEKVTGIRPRGITTVAGPFGGNYN